MIMDDDSWYVVRHTAGVTKFVGSSKKPIPARVQKLKRLSTLELASVKKSGSKYMVIP